MAANEISYKPGDLVKHKGSFLRSIGWFTDVPVNGKVLSTVPMGSMTLPVVEWSNGTMGPILPTNIMPASAPDNS